MLRLRVFTWTRLVAIITGVDFILRVRLDTQTLESVLGSHRLHEHHGLYDLHKPSRDAENLIPLCRVGVPKETALDSLGVKFLTLLFWEMGKFDCIKYLQIL